MDGSSWFNMKSAVCVFTVLSTVRFYEDMKYAQAAVQCLSIIY